MYIYLYHKQDNYQRSHIEIALEFHRFLLESVKVISYFLLKLYLALMINAKKETKKNPQKQEPRNPVCFYIFIF